MRLQARDLRSLGRASPPPHPMQWSAEAESRLKEVPFFVRPVVRRRIETLASEAGLAEVSEAFFEQAKAQFGQN